MKTSTKYFILVVLIVFVLFYLYGVFAALFGISIWAFSVGNAAYYLIEEGKYGRVD